MEMTMSRDRGANVGRSRSEGICAATDGAAPDRAPKHRVATAMRILTPATDDVTQALHYVPIATLTETPEENAHEPSLLQLVETILRGGEDQRLAVGITHGSLLGPLAPNATLITPTTSPWKRSWTSRPAAGTPTTRSTSARACPRPPRSRVASEDSWRTETVAPGPGARRPGIGPDPVPDPGPRRSRSAPRNQDGPAGVDRVARPGPRRPDGRRHGADPANPRTALVPRVGPGGGAHGPVHDVPHTPDGPLHGGPTVAWDGGRGRALRGGSAGHH